MFEKYKDKEVFICDFWGTRLNLNEKTFSLCHEFQVGDIVLGNIQDLTPDAYYEALDRVVCENEKEDAPCRLCLKGKKQAIVGDKKINYVTVNTSYYCNSSCIYCTGHFGAKNSGYNPLDYLKPFHDKHLFKKDCYFDWGGGEPTLNPFFEQTVNWLNENGYQQRINTNAILYSEATENALRKNIANVRISIDSGTRDCFEYVKGHIYYDEVWDNIRKYCAISDEVYVKYNVCNYNSDSEQVEMFVQMCKKNGVKNIIIDAEVFSYQPKKNAGPFYYTEKEFNAMHMLQKLAENENLKVHIREYAFSVRAEYDSNGKIKLPTKYFDNIDKDIILNNIKVLTMPNKKELLNFINKNQQLPLIIYGAGIVGQKALEMFEKCDVKVHGFIDKNEDLQNNGFNGYAVISPKSFEKMKTASIVLLAGGYWKEMLREINEKNINTATVIWMPNIHFEQ